MLNFFLPLISEIWTIIFPKTGIVEVDKRMNMWRAISIGTTIGLQLFSTVILTSAIIRIKRLVSDERTNQQIQSSRIVMLLASYMVYLASVTAYWIDLIKDVNNAFYVIPFYFFMMRLICDFITQCIMISIFNHLVEVMCML